jgi:quinol-cytochrome oxidoreductase complex cytochrome b subunit
MSVKKNGKNGDSIPFYPDHVRTELRVAAGLMVGILMVGIWGLVSPVGLGDPADPMNTPADVKPEWYFLALYQLLKYIPKTAGVIIPLVIMAILTLWPFLDRKSDSSPRALRIRLMVVVIIQAILIGLTIWGEVS